MKQQRIQCIAALFTIASAGLALGCGCSSARLEPVREVIVQQRSTTCLMEPSSTVDWGAPFRTIGHVIAAPFVALGSAFTPSYTEPVAEQTYCPSYRSTMLAPVGERFTTVKTIRTSTMLEPVGERFITERSYYRSTLPVGERTVIIKHHHHKKMLKPVGEQFTSGKRYQKTMLKPVGEKHTTIIKKQQW